VRNDTMKLDCYGAKGTHHSTSSRKGVRNDKKERNDQSLPVSCPNFSPPHAYLYTRDGVDVAIQDPETSLHWNVAVQGSGQVLLRLFLTKNLKERDGNQGCRKDSTL